MSDYKLAAEAIRSLAEWKDRAVKAEEKVATYVRKDRVSNISKQAEKKGALLPPKLNLMKCSEEELGNLERALEIITPRGDIKLASIEGESNSEKVNTPAERSSELEEFLLDRSNGFGSR